MATSADQDSYMTHPLADFCECAIHMGLLQQPKLLPCGHSFCLDCLQTIHNTEVTKGLHPNAEVRCPTCTQQHQLPAGGIPKLPVDFKSNQLIEIINQETKQQLDVAAKESHTVALEAEDDLKLCTICNEEGQNITGVQYCITCSNVMCDNCLVIHDREMKQHVKVPLEYEKVICKTHKTRFVNRYCIQCCTPVCMLCIMRDHSQHKTAEFVRSDQTKHEQIQALRDRLTQTENSLQSKLKSITATKVKNSSDCLRTKQDIASCISSLKTQLDREHELMIAQLDNYHSDTYNHIVFSEVRIHELLKSISDVTLQLNQVEYPIGIESVTLIKHPSIKGYLETSSEIEKGHSSIVEKLPSYQYTAGSANPGVLTIRDTDSNSKSDANTISTASETHITGHGHNPAGYLVHTTSSVSPVPVRLPPETASNTVTAGSRHATPYGHHPSGFIIHNKIEVFIHKCDITKLHVDAVVNAANNGLYHGGGVARAISKAAGPELDKEGRHLVNQHGKLAESMVAVTTGGNMPCKKVIHAVGPQWPKGADQQKEQRCLILLYETFKNIMEESNKYGFRSLAMPAVSSGKLSINTIVYIPIICESHFIQILV